MRRRVGSTSFAADVARVSAHALPRGCAARGRAVTPASGTPPAALPDPGRMFGDLVDAHEGVDPPLLRFLVDLALAHDEARVQPAVAVVLRQQFEPRDDRSAPPVCSWTLCPWTVRRMSASSVVRMTPRRFGVHTPSSRLRGALAHRTVPCSTSPETVPSPEPNPPWYRVRSVG